MRKPQDLQAVTHQAHHQRPSKLSRGEASAKSIVTDLPEGYDKAKRRREELELRQ